MNKRTITVSELNRHIKDIIEADMLLSNVIVKGEISNFKYHSSGHMYFTLKDEDSKIRAVMFKGYNCFLKFKPEDGMKVIIEGYVSLYERDGQYQLYCCKMQSDGLGDLYVAFEQLKTKLLKEGLFDDNYKKPIPLLPRRIGIATSATGAVIRDIINVASRRFNDVNLLLYPVKVQGDGAAKTIIEAIEYFNSRDDIDVIIIGRGGGSIEELWPFNEESLARSVFNSKIPIISAVGHETDFTIADFVADVRASTPSQAAEIAVPSYDELVFKINNIVSTILLNCKNNISLKRYVLSNKLEFLNKNSPENRINQSIQYVDSMQNRLINCVEKNMTRYRAEYEILVSKLDSISPLKVLGRGYSYVEKDNYVVNSVKLLNVDDDITLHLHDGNIECRVINIMEGDLWQLEKKI